MAVVSEPEDVSQGLAAGAPRALAAEASNPAKRDDPLIATLFNDLLEQWRSQLAELSVKY